jgi:opacity protein-like surface antigen
MSHASYRQIRIPTKVGKIPTKLNILMNLIDMLCGPFATARGRMSGTACLRRMICAMVCVLLAVCNAPMARGDDPPPQTQPQLQPQTQPPTELPPAVEAPLAGPEPAYGWNAPVNASFSLGGVMAMDRDVREYPFSGPGDKLKLHPGVGFTVGMNGRITRWLRLEFETGLLINTIDRIGRDHADGYLAHVPLMMNVMVAYETPKSRWVPYIGAGFGGDFNELLITSRDTGIDDIYTDVTYACQAMAGVRYAISRGASIGVGYKFYHSGSSRYEERGSHLSQIRFGESDTHSVSLVFLLAY